MLLNLVNSGVWTLQYS